MRVQHAFLVPPELVPLLQSFTNARLAPMSQSVPSMIKSLFLSILFCSLAMASQLQAQTPARSGASQMEAFATNGAGREQHLVSVHGLLPLVRVQPNQTVPIRLQFPTDLAGTSIAVTPLDGGRVNPDALVVLPTGQVIMTFSTGAMPGRYRVAVQTPVEKYLLEFYVVDPNNAGRKS